MQAVGCGSPITEAVASVVPDTRARDVVDSSRSSQDVKYVSAKNEPGEYYT